MSADKPGVHSGHRARMRSRFSKTGLSGFQPHEILEMLLYCLIPKKDVNPLAHALLEEFGSLNAVFCAPPEALARVPGVGAQTAGFFETLRACLSVYLESSRLAPQNVVSLSSTLRYLPASARNSLRHTVTVLFTDRFNRPLAVHSYPGHPDDPGIIRQILAQTLSLHSYSAIIFCTGYRSTTLLNQHAADSLQPLVAALTAVDSFVMDCILLTRTHLLSLRRENLLRTAATELQGNLPRPEHWLGPLSAQSSEPWQPISLLEEPQIDPTDPLNEISPIQ